MWISADVLIDGVVKTLMEVVAPEVKTRYARGQLWAAIDVLRNLRDRVEESSAAQATEAESAEAALREAAAALGARGDDVAAALAAVPAAPVGARLAALRAALVTTLATLDALPPDAAPSARAAVGGHLAMQALRDVAALKPSLLGEISRG